MTDSSQSAALKSSSDRVPFHHMLAYGAGAFVNNLLAGAVGTMLIVLNLGLGMDPALAGLLGALPRFVDAVTDPLMGYISDHTKSRWGRRRPYIFCGAILAGLAFILLWQMPADQSESFYFWYFLIASLVFYLGYTVFATPWVAIGYELTPDYDERSRLMGTQNFIGQLAYFVPPWLLLIMSNTDWFVDLREGASGVSIIIGVFVMSVGVIPALVLKERLNAQNQNETTAASAAPPLQPTGIWITIKDFAKGIGETLTFVPFLKLCIATFLVFNGFIMIAAFQTYVMIYYLHGGNTEAGSALFGISGTIRTISSFLVIAIVTWLSTRYGKIKAFAISTGLSVIGYASKWFLYTPEYPHLALIPEPLIAFALGGLFTLMPAMVADVVDWDELKTGERREGVYGSIFWWVVKLGQSIALAGGGFLLSYSGFNEALGGEQSADTLMRLRAFDAFIPAVISLIAIYVVWSFGLTKEKAQEIRDQLEIRRGALNPAE